MMNVIILDYILDDAQRPPAATLSRTPDGKKGTGVHPQCLQLTCVGIVVQDAQHLFFNDMLVRSLSRFR